MKLLSRVRPSATPWTAAYQAPPSMGFSRQEYWSVVPLPSPPWTWVCTNTRAWGKTGKPGVLQSMGSQTIRHYLGTEQTKDRRAVPWVDFLAVTFPLPLPPTLESQRQPEQEEQKVRRGGRLSGALPSQQVSQPKGAGSGQVCFNACPRHVDYLIINERLSEN